MNSKFYSFLIGMVLMIAGVTLTSCSDDDNNNSTSKATKATAQPVVYITDDMLTLYDVTCTVDGKTVTLTKDNTVATSQQKIGVYTYNYDLREYKIPATTYTKFPSSMEVTTSAKVKSNVNLQEVDKFNFCLCLSMNLTNDNDSKWSSVAETIRISMHNNVRGTSLYGSYLEKYNDVTKSASLTFTSADNFSLSYTGSKL